MVLFLLSSFKLGVTKVMNCFLEFKDFKEEDMLMVRLSFRLVFALY